VKVVGFNGGYVITVSFKGHKNQLVMVSCRDAVKTSGVKAFYQNI